MKIVSDSIFIFATVVFASVTLAGCSHGASASATSNEQAELAASGTDNSAGCAHRILLIPQTHATVLTGSLQVLPQNESKTVFSQFAIAKYLEKNKSLPVFSEQVSTDVTVQTVSVEFRRVAKKIRTLFSKGLPNRVDQLDSAQKEVLAKAGGDAVSFILGITERLHRVVENDQIENAIIDKVSIWAQNNPSATTEPPEIKNLIFEVREKLALEQINNFFNFHPDLRDAVLIFGSDHSQSFKTHAAEFAPRCIVIPEEFQSAMTSPE